MLRTCQERLLQCATPDSVTRLRSSRLRSEAERIWTTYFREQEQSSLANFLEKVIGDVKSSDGERAKVPLRAQVKRATLFQKIYRYLISSAEILARVSILYIIIVTCL